MTVAAHFRSASRIDPGKANVFSDRLLERIKCGETADFIWRSQLYTIWFVLSLSYICDDFSAYMHFSWIFVHYSIHNTYPPTFFVCNASFDYSKGRKRFSTELTSDAQLIASRWLLALHHSVVCLGRVQSALAPTSVRFANDASMQSAGLPFLQ